MANVVQRLVWLERKHSKVFKDFKVFKDGNVEGLWKHFGWQLYSVLCTLVHSYLITRLLKKATAELARQTSSAVALYKGLSDDENLTSYRRSAICGRHEYVVDARRCNFACKGATVPLPCAT